jgi:hypothetical protein
VDDHGNSLVDISPLLLVSANSKCCACSASMSRQSAGGRLLLWKEDGWRPHLVQPSIDRPLHRPPRRRLQQLLQLLLPQLRHTDGAATPSVLGCPEAETGGHSLRECVSPLTTPAPSTYRYRRPGAAAAWTAHRTDVRKDILNDEVAPFPRLASRFCF